MDNACWPICDKLLRLTNYYMNSGFWTDFSRKYVLLHKFSKIPTAYYSKYNGPWLLDTVQEQNTKMSL